MSLSPPTCGSASGRRFTLNDASRNVAPQHLADTLPLNSVQALGTSLMPENLDAALPPQALADLIAYLTRG